MNTFDILTIDQLPIPSAKIHVTKGSLHPSTRLSLSSEVNELGLINPSISLHMPGRESSFDVELSTILYAALSAKLDFAIDVFPSFQIATPKFNRLPLEYILTTKALLLNLRIILFDFRGFVRDDRYRVSGTCSLFLKGGGECKYFYPPEDGDDQIELGTFFSDLPALNFSKA